MIVSSDPPTSGSFGEIALLHVELRTDQQAAHADDRVHRVRISWLIEARNVLFASFAASASRRRDQLGDVVVDRVVAAVLAVDDQRDEDDLDVDALAVLAPPPADEVGRPVASAVWVVAAPSPRSAAVNRRSSMWRPMASSGS